MLIDATDGKHYYYEDEFMYFSFDGINSRKYRLFIVNDKKGFNWYTSTGASVKVEKPLYQNYTYYIGTDRSQKKMDLNVAAEGLTDAEIKDMFVWLEEGRTGFLTVDWNMDWGYDVVLASVSNAEMLGHGYKSVLTFKLTFQTIGEFRARAAWDISGDIGDAVSVAYYQSTNSAPAEYDANVTDNYPVTITRSDAIANGYGIPEMDVVGASNNTYTINIPMVCNQYQYVDYTYNITPTSEGTSSFIIADGADMNYLTYVYDNSEASQYNNISYYGRSGYVLVNNSTLIDSTSLGGTNTQSGALLRLTGAGPRKLTNYTLSASGNTFSLQITGDDAIYLSQLDRPYISVSVPVPNVNQLPYNIGTYTAASNYPMKYYNLLLEYPEIDVNENDEIAAISYSITKPDDENITTDYIKKYGLFYCGEYNQLAITNSNAANRQLTVHKYNNL